MSGGQGRALRGPTVAVVLGCVEAQCLTKLAPCGGLLISIEFFELSKKIDASGGILRERWLNFQTCPEQPLIPIGTCGGHGEKN